VGSSHGVAGRHLVPCDYLVVYTPEEVLWEGLVEVLYLSLYGIHAPDLSGLGVGVVADEVGVEDLNMPKMSGIEATRRILEASPDIAILMLTMFQDDDSVFAAVGAGAHGYVLKGADGAEAIRGIRAVASGEAILSPTVERRLTEHFRRGRGRP